MKRLNIYAIIDLLLLMALLLVACLFYFGRSPIRAEPKAFIPSHEQTLELKVLQLEAIAQEKDYLAAQKSYNDTLRALQSKAAEIKTANHWPADLAFDAAGLSFKAAAPKPEAPKPAPAAGKAAPGKVKP